MKCLNKQLAYRIINIIRKRIRELPSDLKNTLYSLVVYGSLIRGDFLDDVSDIDILVVFKDEAKNEDVEKILKMLKEIEDEFKMCKNYAILDIAWVYERELPLDGKETNTFFKFLTIYAFDFIKNSKIIYGEDFRNKLVVKDPKYWIPDRIKRLENLLNKALKDSRINYLTIVVGEIIRLAAITFGEANIKKDKVINTFIEHVPDYPEKNIAKEIWREYHTPRYKKKLTQKYINELIIFSRATLKMIEKHLEKKKEIKGGN